MRSKYGAQRTEVDGIVFASKKEAKRYSELKLLEKAGDISHLEIQPRIKLFSGDVPVKFDSGRQAVYVADFRYFDKRLDARVTEDVKGTRTPEYKLKKAFVQAQFPGLKILET